MNLNKVFVLGNITRDPEQKSLPSGQPVASFGLATNRFYTQNGEKKQDTEFHNIVTFGRLAEIASQYLKKGSLVLIEGHLRTRNWQDSSGVKHYRTEITAERMQLGPRTGGFQTSGSEATGEKTKVSEEEIPVIEEEPAQKENPKDNPANNKNDDKGVDVSEIPF